MTVCFDIDGVLCDQVEGNYADAQPRRALIDLVNRLYGRGYRIILHTSRFMGRAKNDRAEAEKIGREFTVQQLAGWGVHYHELWMGKPRYDYVVDDRSVFYNGEAMQVEAWLEERASEKVAQD